MVECTSIESIKHNSIGTSNLNNQQLRLNKISEIEDYFITEFKERELMSKKLSKYISFFYYFDKSLIVLSVASGSVSTVIGIPVAIFIGIPVAIFIGIPVQVLVLHFHCVQDL